MCRLKKFTDPESSKFKNDINIKEHKVEKDSDMEEQQIANRKVPSDKSKANELIKNSI